MNAPLQQVVYVFGSSEIGDHIGESAKHARAKYSAGSQSIGLTGSSYAIPIFKEKNKQLPFFRIQNYINQFLGHARANPANTFIVSEFLNEQSDYGQEFFYPLFKSKPANVVLPDDWPVE